MMVNADSFLASIGGGRFIPAGRPHSLWKAVHSLMMPTYDRNDVDFWRGRWP